MSSMEALGWAQLFINLVCFVVMWVTCSGYSDMVKREGQRLDQDIKLYREALLVLIKSEIQDKHPDSDTIVKAETDKKDGE